MLVLGAVKQYQVKIYTGDKSGAGCDSNIFLTVYGQFGDTGEREVDKSNNFNKFERNQVPYRAVPRVRTFSLLTLPSLQFTSL